MPNNEGCCCWLPNRDGALDVWPNSDGAVDVAVLEPKRPGVVDVTAVLVPNMDGCDVLVPNPPVCCVVPNKLVLFVAVVVLLAEPNPKLGVVEVAGAALAPNAKLGVVDVAGAAVFEEPNWNAFDVGALDPNDPPAFAPNPPPKDDAVVAAGFAPNVKAIATAIGRDQKLWLADSKKIHVCSFAMV